MRIAILSLFLLLLCGFTKLGSSESADVEPVIDVVDHAVVAGAQYYLGIYMLFPDGGGFRPGNTSNVTTCPLAIVQDPNELFPGNPLKLSSPLGKKEIISTNEAVEISFSDKVKCVESLKWMVVKENGEDFWSLAIGNAGDHHPGGQILRRSFLIQKHDKYQAYKLLFCRDAGICGNTVFHTDEKTGLLRLVMDFVPDSAIPFLFRSK